MIRPNIFKYANRELSQDAMVCWLIACLGSSEYREIGLNFLRFIFNDDTIKNSEVCLEKESPHKQYHRMDVYAVVSVRNKLYPIIFENKTNTYLHSNQFKKYCGDVASWMVNENHFKELSNKLDIIPEGWGEIIYVFFKTGYMFGWQKRDFANQKKVVESELKVGLSVREIYLDDMVAFLECQDRKDLLLEDYYTVLKEQKENRDYALEHGLESVEACNKALDADNDSNETGCAVLFENIFGEGIYFHYDHQHWASRDLFFITDEQGNKTHYCYRFQSCSYENKKWAYAFNLQQYRNEKNDTKGKKEKALEIKIEQAERIKEICESIVKNTNCPDVKLRFEKLHKYPCKSYNGQMIMKVFIVNESSPVNVCNFIKEFTGKLRNEVKENFDSSVTVSDYFKVPE